MPKISFFYGIIIRMFFNDHAPPHFHAEYAEHKASIDIKKLALIEGDMPRRALELVLDWAELHQDELLEDWDLCISKQAPKKIEPLNIEDKTMYWDVIKAEPQSNLDILVEFQDGIKGKIHFHESHLQGVFEPLQDDHFFQQVFIDNGVVTWPGEIDIAPDAMYQAIKKEGIWDLK